MESYEATNLSSVFICVVRLPKTYECVFETMRNHNKCNSAVEWGWVAVARVGFVCNVYMLLAAWGTGSMDFDVLRGTWGVGCYACLHAPQPLGWDLWRLTSSLWKSLTVGAGWPLVRRLALNLYFVIICCQFSLKH